MTQSQQPQPLALKDQIWSERQLRFVNVGTVTVGPTTIEVEVGPFSLKEGDDTVWVTVTQISPDQKWNYSYGLLWWQSDGGRELGTEKVYGVRVGECFRFGLGRAPRFRDGRFYFAPRAYNRAWIGISDPPTWTLAVSAESGKTGGGGTPIPTDPGAWSNVFTDIATDFLIPVVLDAATGLLLLNYP